MDFGHGFWVAMGCRALVAGGVGPSASGIGLASVSAGRLGLQSGPVLVFWSWVVVNWVRPRRGLGWAESMAAYELSCGSRLRVWFRFVGGFVGSSGFRLWMVGPSVWVLRLRFVGRPQVLESGLRCGFRSGLMG